MDNGAALASGTWTASVTGAGAILTAPEAMSVWLWLVGIVITALLSLASSLIVGLVAAWFHDWLKRRREREKEEKEGTLIH